VTERERDLIAWRPEWTVNPGEILQEKLDEMHVSQFEAATRMGVSQPYVSMLCSGRKGIGPGTAIKLEALTGISAELWARLWAQYAVAKQRERQTT
jgi:HTH-type transcriptional regulator/antitoxin HigA